MSKRKSQAGTVMLALLVVIIIGGLVASRLVPSFEIQKKRETDVQLRFNLGLLRQGFDLKSKADPTYNPSLTTRAEIKDAIASLSLEGFLNMSTLRDPTVPAHLWDKSDDTYWKIVENLAETSSFESDEIVDGFLASWSTGAAGTIAATDSTFFPSLGSSNLDNYAGQNKLGELMSTRGNSVKLTR